MTPAFGTSPPSMMSRPALWSLAQPTERGSSLSSAPVIGSDGGGWAAPCCSGRSLNLRFAVPAVSWGERSRPRNRHRRGRGGRERPRGGHRLLPGLEGPRGAEVISLATTRVVDASVQSELLECVVPLPWGPCRRPVRGEPPGRRAHRSPPGPLFSGLALSRWNRISRGAASSGEEERAHARGESRVWQSSAARAGARLGGTLRMRVSASAPGRGWLADRARPQSVGQSQFFGGRSRVRTCDPPRVRRVLCR